MVWDNVTGRSVGGSGDKYVVLQVMVTEKIFGTESGIASLMNFQAAINE